MINNFFSNIVTFIRYCGNMWYNQTSYRSQTNTV